MSTLPLMFKKEGLVEKHQLEGVDPSDRYFNRTILVNRTSSGYAANNLRLSLGAARTDYERIARM